MSRAGGEVSAVAARNLLASVMLLAMADYRNLAEAYAAFAEERSSGDLTDGTYLALLRAMAGWLGGSQHDAASWYGRFRRLDDFIDQVARNMVRRAELHLQSEWAQQALDYLDIVPDAAGSLPTRALEMPRRAAYMTREQ